MHRFRTAGVLCLSAALSLCCHLDAQQAAHSDVQKLPVKRVLLYKNGVGYFEHAGRVHGSQDLTIDFNSDQLNDVLKSLTLIDLDGGQITGVRYNSVAPLSEQLKSIRLPLGETTSLPAFLTAIRGSRVEVHGPSGEAIGRVLGLEQKQEKDKDTILTVNELSIVTDAGEIKSFTLTPAVSVKLADSDLQQDLNRYLTLMNSARGKDLRRMTVSANGSGDRNIFVSYISEVPVWKSTYRIILPEKTDQKPILQGWAIVDNTVGEDWNDVELSLISGAPQSFIQDLSHPLYTRRPVVPLPQTAMLTPQTHEGTMEEQQDVPGLPGSVATGVVGRVANQGPVNMRKMKSVSRAELDESYKIAANATPQAEANDLGDLFEYKLKEKVTIGKNQSALVPIISSHIEAEKVTLWNSQSQQPLRSLWIKNTSGVDLDSGALNIIDRDTFAGEGIIDPVKPDERRIVSYAIDQAVRIKMETETQNRPVTRVYIVHGIMTQVSEERQHFSYEIRNSDKQERDVVIEHPLREGWKLVGDLKPEETTRSFYRFRVQAAAQNTSTLKLEEMHPLFTQYYLSNINDDQIKLFLRNQTLTPSAEAALRKVLDKKNEIAGYDRQIKQYEAEMQSITNDQNRVRENMKVLKGSPEEKQLLLRYTKQLNTQEDQMQDLTSKLKTLKDTREQSQQALNTMIEQISLDETL